MSSSTLQRVSMHLSEDYSMTFHCSCGIGCEWELISSISADAVCCVLQMGVDLLFSATRSICGFVSLATFSTPFLCTPQHFYILCRWIFVKSFKILSPLSLLASIYLSVGLLNPLNYVNFNLHCEWFFISYGRINLLFEFVIQIVVFMIFWST